MKREVHSRQRALVQEFVSTIKNTMGICDKHVWTLADYNWRIAWGRHKTL
jgi:hypothetical protein